MLFAGCTLLLIVESGPGAELSSLVRKLMERLQYKLGTCPSAMNPFLFAAAFGDRRDTRELLNFQSRGKAIPICAEDRRQPRG